MYPTGFHWGYIHIRVVLINLMVADRRERYIVLRIPTPLRMVKFAMDCDLYKIHEWTFLAFAAWPYEDFPGKLRYRWTHFWNPIYGS